MNIPTPFDILLSTESCVDTDTAARFLSMSGSALERYRSTGEVKIPYVRIGDRLIRYRMSDLISFVEDHTVDA